MPVTSSFPKSCWMPHRQPACCVIISHSMSVSFISRTPCLRPTTPHATLPLRRPAATSEERVWRRMPRGMPTRACRSAWRALPWLPAWAGVRNPCGALGSRGNSRGQSARSSLPYTFFTSSPWVLSRFFCLAGRAPRLGTNQSTRVVLCDELALLPREPGIPGCLLPEAIFDFADVGS